jgi:hypothetical protein
MQPDAGDSLNAKARSFDPFTLSRLISWASMMRNSARNETMSEEGKRLLAKLFGSLAEEGREAFEESGPFDAAGLDDEIDAFTRRGRDGVKSPGSVCAISFRISNK